MADNQTPVGGKHPESVLFTQVGVEVKITYLSEEILAQIGPFVLKETVYHLDDVPAEILQLLFPQKP